MMDFPAEVNCYVGPLLTLLENKDKDQKERKTAYIDLRYGVFSGLHSARDLGRQLNILICDQQLGPGFSSRDMKSPEDIIGFWVDAEGRGDSLITSSHRLASELGDQLGLLEYDSVLILLGDYWVENPLPEEETSFIWLLWQELKIHSIDLAFHQEVNEDLKIVLPIFNAIEYIFIDEADRELNNYSSSLPPKNPLIGGILTENKLKELLEFRVLDDLLLYRIDPSGTFLALPSYFWSLSDIENESYSIVFYDYLRRNPIFYAACIQKGLVPYSKDIPLLCASAWKMSAQGGVTTSTHVLSRLLEYSLSSAPEFYGEILLELQKLRIAAQSYSDASNQVANQGLLTADQKYQFLITLAWGKVLSGDNSGALQAFIDAGTSKLFSSQSRIDLYLLNIYALVIFRNGKHADALDVENYISDVIRENFSDDNHLIYINSFNLARLHRASGDLSKEMGYIEKAFQTTDGLRTEADKIYFNLTLGSFYDRSSRPYEAFVVTLRAAIHWLSCTVQASIGWRTLLAIYGYRVKMSPRLIPDISSKISDLLMKRALAASIRVDYSSPISPRFVSINEFNWTGFYGGLDSLECKYYRSLYRCRWDEGRIDCPNHDLELSSLVSAFLLESSNKITSHKSVNYGGAIYVDDSFGFDLPIKMIDSNRSDGSLRRWISYPGNDIDGILNLRLYQNNAVSNFVAHENVVTSVSYKRYRGIYTVPASSQAFLYRLYKDGEMSVSDLLDLQPSLSSSPKDIMKTVIGMEADRLLSLSRYRPFWAHSTNINV